MNNSSGNFSSCYEIDSHPHKEMILLRISLVGGCVSVLFCCFIFFLAILFRKYTQSTQRLILYLTLCSCIAGFTYILHGAYHRTKETPYCVAVGFIDQMSTWMVLLAACCLTFDLLYKVALLKFDTSRFEPVYLVIIFMVPFTFNWIPFVRHAYGRSGALCWIKIYDEDNDCSTDMYFVLLQLILYWFPSFIIIVGFFIAYTFIFIKTRKELTAYIGKFDPTVASTKQLIHHEARVYAIYPLVMLILYIAGIASRIIQYSGTKNKLYFGMRVAHVLVFSLQGTAMAIVFLLDYDIRRRLTQIKSIKVALYSMFCSCFKSPKVTEYKVHAVVTSDSLQSEKSIPYVKFQQDRAMSNYATQNLLEGEIN